MKNFRYRNLVLVFALGAAHCDAQGVSKCLAYAQTYYEQLYCEIASAGKNRKLPSFTDFQKNAEMTQALILSPHAKALQIAMNFPKRSSALVTKAPSKQQTTSSARKLSGAGVHDNAAPINKTKKGECQFHSDKIACGEHLFVQVTNQHNDSLAANALDHKNILKLPVIKLSPRQEGFDGQLSNVYLLYLEKMISIGLGGVTMTYAKFHYLYLDLLEREVDFNQRFSTMFEFLKKDKRTLGVSSRPATLASFNAQQCSRARSGLFICEHSGRNYLFKR